MAGQRHEGWMSNAVPCCSLRPLLPASAPGWAQTCKPGGREMGTGWGTAGGCCVRGDAGGRGARSRQRPGPLWSPGLLLGELPEKGRALRCASAALGGPAARHPTGTGMRQLRAAGGTHADAGARAGSRGFAEVARTRRNRRQPCPTCPCTDDEDLRVPSQAEKIQPPRGDVRPAPPHKPPRASLLLLPHAPAPWGARGRLPAGAARALPSPGGPRRGSHPAPASPPGWPRPRRSASRASQQKDNDFANVLLLGTLPVPAGPPTGCFP